MNRTELAAALDNLLKNPPPIVPLPDLGQLQGDPRDHAQDVLIEFITRSASKLNSKQLKIWLALYRNSLRSGARWLAEESLTFLMINTGLTERAARNALTDLGHKGLVFTLAVWDEEAREWVNTERSGPPELGLRQKAVFSVHSGVFGAEQATRPPFVCRNRP